MIRVLEKRATISGDPSCMIGYDAELKIESDGKILFVHVNMSDGTHYSVSEDSFYDYMTGETDEEPNVDFIEFYEEMEETDHHEYLKSEYAEYYKMAYDMIMDL